VLPNSRAVINDDFVQECLELIHSSLVIESRKSELRQVSKPKTNTLDGLFAKLVEEFENEAAVQLLTSNIAQIIHTVQADTIKNDDNDILLRLMHAYSSNPQIQLNVIEILESTLRLVVTQRRLEQNRSSSGGMHSHVLRNEAVEAKLIEKFFYVFLKYDSVKEIQLSSVKVIIQLANFGKKLISMVLV
jgi:hypothetical protein